MTYQKIYMSNSAGPHVSVPASLEAPRAKRSLGQNFLQDKNIARKIVSAARITAQSRVLEIGPGPGALTAFLLESGAQYLLLAEKDRFWAQERMRQGAGRLQVVLCDALTLAWERFTEPWVLIGNLPYNVASPIMWDVFSRMPALERAVFMVQKEVGLRLKAAPGTSAYGALSVWVQSFVRPELECLVPPQVFKPRPKVDSAVVSFTPLGPEKGRFDPMALAATLKGCFQMRRKQLGSIVKSRGIAPDALEKLGFDSKLRPENLSPGQFHILSDSGFFIRKH